MTDAPIHLATLGDLLEHGYGMDAWCEACETSRPVDLTRLAMRLGLGWSYIGRRVPLVCAGCGGREIRTSIHTPRGLGPISRTSS